MAFVFFAPCLLRSFGQIRMHALHLGHPVMGDSLYGTEKGKGKSDRLLLHARRISFPHVRLKTFPHLIYEGLLRGDARTLDRQVLYDCRWLFQPLCVGG